MFKNYFTEEDIKEEVENYLNSTFGKMFDDQITVESIIPADMFRTRDYIHCFSQKMNSFFVMERGKKNTDIECDYMQVFYRENYIRPYLTNKCNEIFGENCCFIDNGSQCREINFDLDIDEFMRDNGVSFDLVVKEADVEKKGERYYEDALMTFIENDLKRHWRYPVVTIWICKNMPSGEVKSMDEFDRLWAAKCEKIKYLFVSTLEDFSVINHGWK